MRTAGLALLLTGALFGAQPALAATTKYVSPTGSGTACTQDSPCDINTGAATIAAGDTVVVGAGSYDLGSWGIQVPTGATLEGADGARPTLSGDSISGALVTVSGGTVRHLALNETHAGGGGYMPVYSNGNSILDDLTLTSTGVAAGLGVGDLLRNSTLVSSGGGIAAITMSGSMGAGTGISGAATVLNDVVSAPAADARGIEATGMCLLMPDPTNPAVMTCMAGMSWATTVNVVNSIVRAGGSDLSTTSSGGMSGTVNVSYSDYRSDHVAQTTPGTINAGTGNIAADPLFADAAHGDFHQLVGSPTIDAADPAAASDLQVPATDFDGEARIANGRIDMGPDEYQPPPPAGGSSSDGSGSPTPTQQDAGTQQQQQQQTTTTTTETTSDRTPPKLAKLRLKKSKLSWTDSEAARVTFTVLRCVNKRCTKTKRIRGTLAHSDRRGSNKLAFRGKLRGRKLKAGAYKLVAVARDHAGNKSRAVALRFRIR